MREEEKREPVRVDAGPDLPRSSRFHHCIHGKGLPHYYQGLCGVDLAMTGNNLSTQQCAGCPNYFQQGGLVLSGDTAGGAKPWLNLDANGAITNRTKLGPAPGSFAALEPAEEFSLYRFIASD